METLGTVWTCKIWVINVLLGWNKASKPGHNKVVDFLADIAITWASEESWKGPGEIFLQFVFHVNSISKDQIYWFTHAFILLGSIFIMHTSSALKGRWCQSIVYALFVEETSRTLTFLSEIIPSEMLKWLRLFDWLLSSPSHSAAGLCLTAFLPSGTARPNTGDIYCWNIVGWSFSRTPAHQKIYCF